MRDETAKPIPDVIQREMDRIKSLFEAHAGDAEDLISYAGEIVSLRARAKSLEAALKPFADEAAKWSSDIHFSDFIPALDVLGSACNNCGDDPGYEEAAFTVGDLRRARNELEGSQTATEAQTAPKTPGAITQAKD